MYRVLALCGLLLLAGCHRQARQDAAAPASSSPLSEKQQIAEFWKDVAGVHFTEDRSHAGQRLPTAVLLDTHNSPVTLASTRGKPVLLNFWAHWCVPCRAEMPTINAMADAGRGALTVIAINEDVIRPGGKSLGPLKINPQVREWDDTNGLLSKSLAGGGLPTTVLFGKDGRERWRLVGALDWTKDQASALLRDAT